MNYSVRNMLLPVQEFLKKALAACLFSCSIVISASAQPPANFQKELVSSELVQPVSMAFLPDGQLFVVQKTGEILICEPGKPAPVATTPYYFISNINTEGEHGLIDIALDPEFSSNGYLYVYYTQQFSEGQQLNRINTVSRFTHNFSTNQIVEGSEYILWENPESNASCCHMGGSLVFGLDGKLYLTTGEDFDLTQAQDLSRAGGKVLRFNKDGSIPEDNPFVGTVGALPEIYAYGLRNPFRASLDPVSGNIYIGEVGGNDHNRAWEDIHVVEASANYGWPACGDGGSGRNSDGSCIDPDYADPIFSYPHNGSPASVTGGIRYRGSQFPSAYRGVYFYSDYKLRKMRYLTFDDQDKVTGSYEFDSETIGSAVNIVEGPDGELYWLNLSGELRRYTYNGGNQTPDVASVSADPVSGTSPLGVSFSVVANDDEGDPLSYFWSFGDGNTSDQQNPSHTYTSNGIYKATVSVSDGSTSTASEPIKILVGTPPDVSVTSPVEGAFFRGGDIIHFSASATDPDGALTEESYVWTFDFYHNGVLHPRFEPVVGSAGSFTVPVNNHVSYSGNTGYVIHLEVTDADGLKINKETHIWSEKSNLTLDTYPSGLQLTISGLPVKTPYTTDELINFEHEVGVYNAVQCLDGVEYRFTGWSDGGGQNHTIATPAEDATFTASFEPVGDCKDFCQSLSMDGSSQLNLSSPVVLSGDFTIEYWIKLPSPHNDDAPVSNGDKQYINYYNGQPRFWIHGAEGNDDVLKTTTPLVANEWTHYAFVRSGSDMKLYINGQEDVNARATGLWTADYSMTNIGDGNGYLQGALDEMRIWNVARSSAEIGAYYSTGIDVNTPGLELYYGFNEVDGVVTDLSGHGHDSQALPAGISRLAATAPLTESCQGGAVANQLPLVDAGEDKTIQLPQDTTSFTATASDADGVIVSYLWEQLNGTAATMSNTTTEKLSLAGLVEGAYTFQVTITDDSSATASDQVNLTVNAESVNTAPVLATVENQTLEEGQVKALTLTAIDENGDIVNFQLTGTIPPFVRLVDNLDNTATLHMEPVAGDAGSYSLTVRAEDPAGLTDEVAFGIEVLATGSSTCQSLSMDGSSQLNLNNPVVLSGDFTIEYWIKLPSPHNDDAPVSNGDKQYINYYNGQPRFWIHGAEGNDDVLKTTTPLVANEWTHYAFIRSGSDMKLYINGQEDVNARATGLWTADYSMTNIGDGNGYLQGALDEMRIWNVARSSAEIGAYYSTGIDVNTPGLELYYGFNEVDGVVTDLSGHGHDSQALPAGISRLAATAPLTESCQGETIQAVANESSNYENSLFNTSIYRKNAETGAFEISFFPNPVTNHFMIKYKGVADKELKVIIYDATGRVAFASAYALDGEEGLLGVELDNYLLSQGLYIIKCITKKGDSRVVRMSKK